MIDGYTLLPDHADPELYYVLPSRPRLALDAGGRPEFSLVKYLGEDGGRVRAGGFLTLTTELSVAGERLASLAERIASEEAVRSGTSASPGRLRLSPVPFDRGSVELIALGQSSTGTPQSDSNTPDSSVHIIGSGKPTLDATNRSTFQLLLQPFEAELMEEALERSSLPLLVVYRMEFTGLRPSFHVSVDADWESVYDSLLHQANLNVYYVAADASSMVTNALEESGIEVDTEVFGAGEEARARAERARAQLVDWVLDRLFTPAITPEPSSANAVTDAIDDAVWSLTRSLLPGAGYRLRHLKKEELRYLSARMNESVAERREVLPQGALGTLFERMRIDESGAVRPEWPAHKERLVTAVNLDGFPRLHVEVGIEDRFQTDGLSQVLVEIARSDANGNSINRETLAFQSATQRMSYAVNLLGGSSVDLSRPYQYRVEVRFDPSGPFGPQSTVRTEWRSARTSRLIVDPREVYSVREINVALSPLFSFEQFPVVTVELRHQDGEELGLQRDGRVQLDASRRQSVWRYLTQSGTTPFEYRITYHRRPSDGGEIVTAWRPHVDTWLAVPDPLPVKRTLNLFTALPWEKILIAFVQIRYRDPENGIHFDEQIDLSRSTPFVRRDYPIAADGPKALSYRLTMLMTNGELLEGSWRETLDDRLVIDERLVRRRVVRLQSIGGTLRDQGLDEVRVRLQVIDPDGGPPREEWEHRLTPQSEGETITPFDYLLGDPPARAIRYSALFVDVNGFTEQTPWKETNGDLVVVHIGNRSMAG